MVTREKHEQALGAFEYKMGLERLQQDWEDEDIDWWIVAAILITSSYLVMYTSLVAMDNNNTPSKEEVDSPQESSFDFEFSSDESDDMMGVDLIRPKQMESTLSVRKS
ncbi:hypothetical protein PIB30_059577 [Stylosanthes scabra]|uniref:Uncharacterized protein n=1 Tax=Stylosanthes scabra TaxID=79078 RepID=A0ABU6SL46_9FABA|nr:hypothetical protein [Stylosanthes scabra]